MLDMVLKCALHDLGGLRGFQSERAASHVGHIVEVGQEQCHQRGTVGRTLQVYPADPHRDLW